MWLCYISHMTKMVISFIYYILLFISYFIGDFSNLILWVLEVLICAHYKMVDCTKWLTPNQKAFCSVFLLKSIGDWVQHCYCFKKQIHWEELHCWHFSGINTLSSRSDVLIICQQPTGSQWSYGQGCVDVEDAFLLISNLLLDICYMLHFSLKPNCSSVLLFQFRAP